MTNSCSSRPASARYLEPVGRIGDARQSDRAISVRVTEQCTAGCAANGNIANLQYASENWAGNWQGTHSWRASASYVTGAQSMKFGYQGGYLVREPAQLHQQSELAFRVNNGVPNQMTGDDYSL